MPTSPPSPKPPMSARLNQFWANMLTPLNAYIGTGLIIVLLIMSLANLLSGRNDGRHVSVSVQDEGVSVIIGKEAENTQRKDHEEGRNNFEFKAQFGRDGETKTDWHHNYSRWHHGSDHFGRGSAFFGLVLAIMLAGVVGLIAKLILIESHLAALRQSTDTPPATKTARTAGRPKGTVKAKTKMQKKGR